VHHDICTGCGGLQKPLHSLNLALDWVRFVPTTQSPTAIDSRDYLIGPFTLLLVVFPLSLESHFQVTLSSLEGTKEQFAKIVENQTQFKTQINFTT
jgi:hypothetical protein